MPGGPAWLTAQWVAAVLRKAAMSSDLSDVFHDEDFAVLSVTTIPAAEVNENYLSDVWRVVITVSHNPEVPTRSIIVKVPPSNDKAREIAVSSGTFPREMRMYRQILPQLHALQTDDMEPLGPRCLHVDDERLAIVLEDLTEQGFLMADRKTGLNLEQTEAALRCMAHLHAASIALLSKWPTFADGISPCFTGERMHLFGPFFRGALSSLADAVRYWPALGPAYSAVLAAEAQRVEKRLPAAVRVKHAPIVLNHGDPWINNMLFRSSHGGKVLGHRFVDFQQIHLATPAIDLHFFLSLCPARTVLNDHEDALLETYHRALAARLSGLGFHESAAGDLDDLRADYSGTDYFGALFTLAIRPVIIAERDRKLTLESLVRERSNSLSVTPGADDPRTRAINNPQFRKIVEQLLPVYVEKGILCSRPGLEMSSGLSLRRGSLHLQ